METLSSNGKYRIVSQSLSIVENALSDPNKIQMSCSSNSTIKVYDEDNNIKTTQEGEYRVWKMAARNTRLTRPEAHFLYARLSINSQKGEYIWSVNDYEVEESDYYYIKVGSITATESAPDFDEDDYTPREITLDYGSLDTPKYREEGRSSGFEDAFGIGNYTEDGENKQQIVPKIPFRDISIRQTLTLFGNSIRNLWKSTDFATAESIESMGGDDASDGDEALVTGGVVRRVVDWVKSKFLRKDVNDTASGVITFTKQAVMQEGFRTNDYTPGITGSGAALNKDSQGTRMEVDYLTIRKRLEALEIQVQKMSHIGGQIVLSAASAVLTEVEEVEDDIDGTPLIRCYFDAVDSDGNEINNEWAEYDQARCQTFNLVEKNGVSSNRYWWRLVRAVSGQPVNRGGIMRHWFDVYGVDKEDDPDDTQCDTDSDLPAVGDHVVLLGNQIDTTRQNAIIEAGAGTYSPYHRQYKGIDMFALDDEMIKIDLNPSHTVLNVEEFKSISQSGDAQTIEEIVEQGTQALSESIDRKFEDQLSFINSDSPAPRTSSNEAYTDMSVSIAGSVEPSLLWPQSDWDKYVNTYIIWADGLCYKFDGTSWKIVTDSYLIAYIEKLLQQEQVLTDLASDNIISFVEKKSLKDVLNRVRNEYIVYSGDGTYVNIDPTIVNDYIKYANALIHFYEWIIEQSGNVPLSQQVPVPGQGELTPLVTRRLGVKFSEISEVVDGETYSQYDVGYTIPTNMSRGGWADFNQAYSMYSSALVDIQSSINRKNYDRSALQITTPDGAIEAIQGQIDDLLDTLTNTSETVIDHTEKLGYIITKNQDGSYSLANGIVTSENFATMFSRATDENGNTIAEAIASTYLLKNPEDGTILSGYVVKADQLDFEGANIDFTASQNFTVTAQNFSIDSNGIAKVSGIIKRGHLVINEDNCLDFFQKRPADVAYHINFIDGQNEMAIARLTSANWIEINSLDDSLFAEANYVEIELPSIYPGYGSIYYKDELGLVRDYIGQVITIFNNTEKTIKARGLIFNDDYWTGVDKNTGTGLWTPPMSDDVTVIGPGTLAVFTCRADIPVAWNYMQDEAIWWKPYLCKPQIPIDENQSQDD